LQDEPETQRKKKVKLGYQLEIQKHRWTAKEHKVTSLSKTRLITKQRIFLDPNNITLGVV
jgi:hypothetical protein